MLLGASAGALAAALLARPAHGPTPRTHTRSTLPVFTQVGDYHDTLQMPVLAQPSIFTSSVVGVRFQPGPYAGYSVMHCHFLQHEDTGCMKIVKWQCAKGGGKDPQPDECTGFSFPVKGSYQ